MSYEIPFEMYLPVDCAVNRTIAEYNGAIRAMRVREDEWTIRLGELQNRAADRFGVNDVENVRLHKLAKGFILGQKREMFLKIATELPPLLREARREHAKEAKAFRDALVADVHRQLAEAGFSPSSPERKKPFDAHRLIETTNIHDGITDAANQLRDAERLAAAPINVGYFENAVEQIDRELAALIAA